jgi:hypothetical protein
MPHFELQVREGFTLRKVCREDLRSLMNEADTWANGGYEAYVYLDTEDGELHMVYRGVG